MNNIYVYDSETFKHAFIAVFKHIKTGEIFTFEISRRKYQIQELYDFLDKVDGLIGYNNIGFDYPILHDFLKPQNRYNNLREFDGEFLAKQMCRLADQTINAKYSQIDPWKVKIPQADLYLIWHFNNKAKRQSLKGVEAFYNWYKVQDLPYKPNTYLTDLMIDEVIDYCINDVEATYMLYTKSIHKFELRQLLGGIYGIDMTNFNDVKIGSELILKLYCERTGKNPKTVSKQQTRRYSVDLNDCVPDYIQFASSEFNSILNKFRSTTVNPYESEFEYSVNYKGFQYDYGLGGIHGAKHGIFTPDDNTEIWDWDVASLYPSLCITLGLYPQHLGPEFIPIYKDLVDTRLKSKKLAKDKLLEPELKKEHQAISDGLKLSANGTYGKSKDEYSFLHDPLFTYGITIAGQLALTMLAERLVDVIESLEMIQINTDGLSFKINKSDRQRMFDICKQWEQDTSLVLESAQYKKMIMRDVNNYIAQDEWDNLKFKGCFEIDKKIGKEDAPHKNNSQRIVPIALRDYFISNIPVSNTILKHDNIYDFTIKKKKKSDQKYTLVQKNGNIDIEDKVIRYYICNSGDKLFKKYTDETRILDSNQLDMFNVKRDYYKLERVNKGFKVCMFMDYYDSDNYDIDHEYYIQECNKIIKLVKYGKK